MSDIWRDLEKNDFRLALENKTGKVSKLLLLEQPPINDGFFCFGPDKPAKISPMLRRFATEFKIFLDYHFMILSRLTEARDAMIYVHLDSAIDISEIYAFAEEYPNVSIIDIGDFLCA